MKKQWIFNSFIKDFAVLWGAAFPLILLLMYTPQGKAWGLLALVAYVFIDSGHAYATAFRTYFKKNIVFSSPLYLSVPLLCFLIFFSWAYLGVPYLWSFVLYATFYHNTRQHYGILKWYEKINHSIPNSGLFLYALTVLPFIGFHFKSFRYSGIYHEKEFFFYPDQTLFLIFLGLNALTLFTFFSYSLRLHKQGQLQSPVFFSILFPGLVNFCCFSLGTTVDQVLVPMVAIHGIAYFFLTARVLERTSNRKLSLWLLIIPVVVVSAVFGFLEYLTQINFVKSAASFEYRGDWGTSLAVSLVVTPLMTHYFLDAVIWRKKDPEFAKVFES